MCRGPRYHQVNQSLGYFEKGVLAKASGSLYSWKTVPTIVNNSHFLNHSCDDKLRSPIIINLCHVVLVWVGVFSWSMQLVKSIRSVSLVPDYLSSRSICLPIQCFILQIKTSLDSTHIAGENDYTIIENNADFLDPIRSVGLEPKIPKEPQLLDFGTEDFEQFRFQSI